MCEKTDPIVEAVRQDLLYRSQVGIAKYGVTQARTDLKRIDWLRQAYEEVLDLANYLKRSILDIESRADGGADIVTRQSLPGKPRPGPGAPAHDLERLRQPGLASNRLHDRLIQERAETLRENAALKRRVDELFNHNNELLERARMAERKQKGMRH